jgi:hypothetical protein
MEESIDSVHGSWSSTGHGLWWTDHRGWPQSSTELSRVATSGRGGIATRRGNGGGDVVQPGDYSLRLG